MIGFTNAGGGSFSKLGIRVFTSVPSSPKNGDILVYDALPINNGEITPWSIGTDRSDSAGDGYVFIHVDVVPGTFGISYWATLSEKNPRLGLSCYWGPVLQKKNGKYQYMTAKIYIDGVWRQISSTWDGTLYNAGEQYTDRTGGWIVRLQGASGGTLTPALHGYAEKAVTMSTLGKVDLTGFSKLNFTGYGWEDSSGGRDKAHCIVDTAQINPSSNSFPSGAARLDFSGNEASGTYALDISSLSGSYYVGFYAVRNENKIHIDKVWLT